jgi:multidrug efflux pump subunit AcrB
MVKKNSKKEKNDDITFLAKFSLFFFDHNKLSLFIWLFLVVAGILSYTTFHKREGFPPIQVPLGITSGTYFVDDASRVDSDITKPVSAARRQCLCMDRIYFRLIFNLTITGG